MTRWMCVFAQVVVMNGCSSLFSCIAAVVCDPKGKFKTQSDAQNLYPPRVNTNVHAVATGNRGIVIVLCQFGSKIRHKFNTFLP